MKGKTIHKMTGRLSRTLEKKDTKYRSKELARNSNCPNFVYKISLLPISLDIFSIFSVCSNSSMSVSRNKINFLNIQLSTSHEISQ